MEVENILLLFDLIRLLDDRCGVNYRRRNHRRWRHHVRHGGRLLVFKTLVQEEDGNANHDKSNNIEHTERLAARQRLYTSLTSRVDYGRYGIHYKKPGFFFNAT